MASRAGFLLLGPVCRLIGIGHQPLDGVGVQSRNGPGHDIPDLTRLTARSGSGRAGAAGGGGHGADDLIGDRRSGLSGGLAAAPGRFECF
jgi:hypothetical protein